MPTETPAQRYYAVDWEGYGAVYDSETDEFAPGVTYPEDRAKRLNDGFEPRSIWGWLPVEGNL